MLRKSEKPIISVIIAFSNQLPLRNFLLCVYINEPTNSLSCLPHVEKSLKTKKTLYQKSNPIDHIHPKIKCTVSPPNTKISKILKPLNNNPQSMYRNLIKY
jgi:hypothetical protein